MKKYSIYLILLAAWGSSCTDMDESRNGLPLGNSSGYVVTGTVSDTNISARMADVDSEDDSGTYTGTQTTFQPGDPILIGWSGNTATYTYTYSGDNGIFNPATDASTANYGLWKELVASTATDVYAWYGQQEKTLPAADSDISVQSDQTLESGYLKSLRLAAHASVTPATCKALNFDFKHLMACLRIHLIIDDREVTSTDIIGSSATLAGVKTKGKISIGASGKEYQLSVTDGGTAENVKMYKCPWSEKTPYWIDFKCLLPAQTLPEGQKITVTLANGKKYGCTLSEGVTLETGKITSLNIKLEAKGGLSVFVPICTVLDASSCAFSGNRILSAVKDNDRYRLLVYDKKPDGTWGEGEPVYDTEYSSDKFPSDTTFKANSYMKGTSPTMSLYGDYAALGYGTISTYNETWAKTFFIKKSQETGKWFRSDGPFGYSGYAVAISDRFLITGNHVDAKQNGYNTYVYPIDENGDLGTGYISYGMSGYKMSLSGNILATNNGVFQYDESIEKWDSQHPLYGAKYKNQRIATDGKKMIIQNGSNESDVDIYDLKGNAESWEGNKPKGGVGSPVGIYENYALAGTSQGVNICYRQQMADGGSKWKVINPEGGFLEMMKHWDPSITATQLAGSGIIMKGTRALILSDNKAYFVENIDKMVEDWIKTPY